MKQKGESTQQTYIINMFEDVELYLRDLKKYYEDVQELNSEGLDLEDKKRKELDDKFKDKLRKYLPSSLNIINTTFDCKFSLYKEGQDLDAKLYVINTKVKNCKYGKKNSCKMVV